jgi:hypothetical protein
MTDYAHVKQILEDYPNITEFQIVVGGGTRDGITPEMSMKIWELYKPLLSDKVKLISSTSPLTYIKDYIKEREDDDLKSGLTIMKDFENLRKEGLNAAMAGSSARYTAQAIDYFQKLFDVERMAEGGIVNSPTFALIGEAGSEAVIPLDKMGGMGTTVNVNVAGSVISEGELQSVIQDALYNLNRSGSVTQLTNLGR